MSSSRSSSSSSTRTCIRPRSSFTLSQLISAIRAALIRQNLQTAVLVGQVAASNIVTVMQAIDEIGDESMVTTNILNQFVTGLTALGSAAALIASSSANAASLTLTLLTAVEQVAEAAASIGTATVGNALLEAGVSSQIVTLFDTTVSDVSTSTGESVSGFRPVTNTRPNCGVYQGAFQVIGDLFAVYASFINIQPAGPTSAATLLLAAQTAMTAYGNCNIPTAVITNLNGAASQLQAYHDASLPAYTTLIQTLAGVVSQSASALSPLASSVP